MKTLVLLFMIAVVCEGTGAQYACSEPEVNRIESIKAGTESLVPNAKSVTKDSDAGFTITAYYGTVGSLLKLRAESNLSENEQLYFENGVLCYYEISGYRKGEMFFEAYYFSNGSLFCAKNVMSGSVIKISSEDGNEIISKAEKYLEEIQ